MAAVEWESMLTRTVPVQANPGNIQEIAKTASSAGLNGRIAPRVTPRSYVELMSKLRSAVGATVARLLSRGGTLEYAPAKVLIAILRSD